MSRQSPVWAGRRSFEHDQRVRCDHAIRAAEHRIDIHLGQPAADIEALAAILVQVSAMAFAMQDRLAEMDINPVFCGPNGAVAADALVVLK